MTATPTPLLRAGLFIARSAWIEVGRRVVVNRAASKSAQAASRNVLRRRKGHPAVIVSGSNCAPFQEDKGHGSPAPHTWPYEGSKLHQAPAVVSLKAVYGRNHTGI